MNGFVQRNYEYILLSLTGVSLLVLVIYIAITNITSLSPWVLVVILGVFYIPLTLLYARVRTQRLREIEAARRARIEPFRTRVRARFQEAFEDIRRETPTLSDFDRAYMIQQELDALASGLDEKSRRYIPPC